MDVLTALTGSKSFIELDASSEYEYIKLFNDTDANEDYYKTTENGIIYHNHSIRSMLDIKNCALPNLIVAYDSVTECSNTELDNFCTEFSDKLSNIYPFYTYETIIRNIEGYIANNTENVAHLCMRDIGLLWANYYLNSITRSKEFTDYWKQQYSDAKNNILTLDDVKNQLEYIKSKQFHLYYKNTPIRHDIHDQYKSIIEKILMEE